MKIAIIGGGVSGLACARRLKEAGVKAKVFDKGHQAGGRISTRIANRNTDPLSFDHGAQYFTARDERFKTVVEQCVESGHVGVWSGNIGKVDFDRRVFEPDSRSNTRYVGTPKMASIAEYLSQGIDLNRETRAITVSKQVGKMVIAFADGKDEGGFDLVVLAIPPEQAAALIVGDEDFKSKCSAVGMAPCWAVMCAFSERLPIDYDGLFVNQSKISWAARDSSKPGRADGERWVLHGSAEWSKEHIEDDSAAVEKVLLEEFRSLLTKNSLTPYFQKAHRWRYAIPTEPLQSNCLISSDQSLATCGDWCGGPRVEGAFLSGLGLAERILSSKI
jgi:predicted NAD/FAD-dependent oxidoreductase